MAIFVSKTQKKLTTVRERNSMKTKINKILLFISKGSVYFSTDIKSFKKIITVLGKNGALDIDVIDIAKNPEMAEKYRIEALPTLIIGDKKYIGKPSAEKAVEIFNKRV